MAEKMPAPITAPMPEHHEVEGAERALEAASRSLSISATDVGDALVRNSALSWGSPRRGGGAPVRRKAGMIACGFLRDGAKAARGDPMLVVMRQDATQEQIAGVVRGGRGARLQGPPDPGRAAHRDRHHRQQGRLRRARVREPARRARGHPRHARLQARLARGEARGQRRLDRRRAGRRAGSFVVVAGPCAVESREQTLTVARAVKAAGAHLLRGGAFKPRTSPYSFQGLGEQGLQILAARPRGDRAARGHRGDRRRERRPRRALRRRDPDRRAQHAELLAAQARGPRARSRCC